MALIITIQAAYDLDDLDEIEDIEEAICSALCGLRGMGAARVVSAVNDDEQDTQSFIKLDGLSEFEFVPEKPLPVCITFD